MHESSPAAGGRVLARKHNVPGHLLHGQVPDVAQRSPARGTTRELGPAAGADEVPALALQDGGQHVVEADGALEQRGEVGRHGGRGPGGGGQSGGEGRSARGGASAPARGQSALSLGGRGAPSAHCAARAPAHYGDAARARGATDSSVHCP